jgi:hypothetical protein
MHTIVKEKYDKEKSLEREEINKMGELSRKTVKANILTLSPPTPIFVLWEDQKL